MPKTLNYAVYHGLHLWYYDDLTDIGLDGCQYVFRFNNGFGASVINHKNSYGYKEGLWELAVIKFNPEIDGDWSLTCQTDITDDVIGWLTDEDVNKLLRRIQNLDENGHETDDILTYEGWEELTEEILPVELEEKHETEQD